MRNLIAALLFTFTLPALAAPIPANVPVVLENNDLYELRDPGDAVWLGPGAFGDFRPTGDTTFEFVFITQEIIDWGVAIIQASPDAAEHLIGLDGWENYWQYKLDFVEFEVTHPSPIPLPAAGWLFITALGSLAAARRYSYG